jgi:lysophospholipase L1-like esterase
MRGPGGVRWIGRVDLGEPQRPRFAWSGSGFVARFTGTSLAARLGGGALLFKAIVDGTPQPAFTTAPGTPEVVLATGLGAGTHTVALHRQSEGGLGDSALVGLTVGGGDLLAPPAGPGRLLEVIGDSISAGYGLHGTPADPDGFATQSHWDSYGAILGRALGAEVSTIAASGRGICRGYDGDPAGALPLLYDRITPASAAPWDFRVAPQAVVINLGTNDVNNGKGDPGPAFRDGYRALVERVRAAYPGAVIVCLVAPLLPAGDVALIAPYIQAVVNDRQAAGDGAITYFGGIPTQTSDKAAGAYHPNAAEHRLMADALVPVLRAQLGW